MVVITGWCSAKGIRSHTLPYPPIKDSDQPAHLRSLIRIFDGGYMVGQGPKVSSRGKVSLLSDSADAQMDLNLSCAHIPTCTLCWILAEIS